jgi:hypothetical protein
VILACASAISTNAWAIGQTRYIETIPSSAASVPLVASGAAAALVVDAGDWPGVVRAARDLQADVNRVTGITPTLVSASPAPGTAAVIIGTIGRSPIIDRLVRERRIDVSSIRGRWESFLLQTVANPMPGISRALVIAGSDKRGTIQVPRTPDYGTRKSMSEGGVTAFSCGRGICDSQVYGTR